MLNSKSYFISRFFYLSSIRLLSICVFLSQFSFAQKKDPKKEENIGTEVVNVVKPYTPTLSDAFKIGETPVLNESENSQKEVIKYAIFSFPVASTFTPSKGKAEGVEKEKQARLFTNYATLGLGNFGAVNAELFVNQELGSNDYVGGIFRHLSSQGGIDSIELKNSFYDTAIDLTYGVRDSEFTWNVDLGYQNQIYNWYGLPSGFATALNLTDRNNLINSINPQQSYNNLYLGGRMQMDSAIFKEATAKFNYFADGYGSSESRLYFKPSFNITIDDFLIKTDLVLDYLGGDFSRNYQNTQAIKYGFTNFGIAPSFVLHEDDWTINIGLGLFYSMGTEESSNKFYVYPKINASYKVVGDLMIFYAGAEGNLEQNTYADFVADNPFLSPTLTLNPTNKQYELFAGLKGKLTHTIGYNIKGAYATEKDRALFMSNNYNLNGSNENYAFGNSMQLVYDNMKTISFYGEVKADVSEDFSCSIDGLFRTFTNEYQAEAWNLPAIQLNAKADYSITEKWYAGIKLFFVGDRKDQKLNTDIVNVVAPGPITLDSYFDLNAHVGFKYNEQLTAFLRANNITNNNYQKWLDYPVQGFQIVLGANYKFDF